MLNISIGLEQATAAINGTSETIIDALDEAVDDLLGLIEATQIQRYTQDQYPTKPSGSDYERTFTLRDSSKKRRSTRLAGEWYTELSYAPFVLGSMSEQATIHKDRWLPTETVSQQVMDKAPAVIAAQVEKRFTT
jgi:hypothetical protein